MTTRKKLCNIKGISEAKMEKIKEAAVKLSGVWSFTSIQLDIILIFFIGTLVC